MKKLCLRLPGRRTYFKFWHFNFPNFQTTFVKIFTKKPAAFKINFESTDKVLRIHQYYDLKFLDNETTALWFFFEICTEEPFASQILSNEGNIKASVLLILLKCIVVSYSNGNESFTGRLFSNYGPLNMLFHFFDVSFIVFSTGLLPKSLWTNYPFSTQISKVHFKM